MKGFHKYYKQIMITLGCALIVCVLLFVDLITKAAAEASTIRQSSYFLGIIRLWYTSNPGIAFGIFGDNPVAMEVMSYVTIVLALLIAVMFFTIFRKNLPVRVCLAVVEAGALGFFITGGVVAVIVCILFIGKDAVFPLTKKWREEAKRDDRERDVRNGHAGQEERHD